MGISKLNGSWAAVIQLCKINKIDPLTAFNLLDAHIDQEFFGKSEKHSFWIAVLYEDRLISKKETGYKIQEYIVRNYGPLVDERLYGKSVKNISWGVKNEKVYNKSFRGKHVVKYRDTSITNIHNLRQKIRGKYKRAKTNKSWKEFYTKLWPNIKKSKEFTDIIKSLKFK